MSFLSFNLAEKGDTAGQEMAETSKWISSDQEVLTQLDPLPEVPGVRALRFSLRWRDGFASSSQVWRFSIKNAQGLYDTRGEQHDS